ncbi:pyridoxamine 5'-phosphate oxidase family protein [Chitinispirillales bacterium ANBcel5]|uniref:pyridoxamine 5'-phosphate oxidase family protein n=1 Tax=Cellulosispirillum alkaliphilum TaxID=3039283 RepID=UPI002A56C15C|nr:pyridoxamine 5'-phosphate oxidase family protein [Chitinispirillales bacterium ANBcel5]
METIEQIREFTNQYPVAWLATAENDQPHVRGMMMWFADETGFYFHTGTSKRLSDQLHTNPKAEIAYFNPGDGLNSQMVRITGDIQLVNDEKLKAKLFEDREWLHAVRDAFPDQEIFIFRIAHGEAQYWDMSRNCTEKDIAPIVF